MIKCTSIFKKTSLTFALFGIIALSTPAHALWVEINEALKSGDTKTVIAHALPAATNGDVDAQIILAKIYASEESNIYDYKKSRLWWEKAAMQGSREAQYQMGEITESGQETKPDYRASIDWYQKSSNQGYSSAQFRLGLIYYNGENTAQNHTKAYELFKLSSEQGEYKSHLYLALMLAKGEGAPKDLIEAYKWATIYDWKVADDSLSIKAELKKEMKVEQTKQAVERAELWISEYKRVKLKTAN